MSELLEQPKIRTEDLKPGEIKALFVETPQDRRIVQKLKAATPTIVEGSRGTGKSFLFKIAEIELDENYQTERVLPVYLSFNRSSLIYTSETAQFHNWMMAKLCSRLLRALKSKGHVSPIDQAIALIAGGAPNTSLADGQTKLDDVAARYEASFRNPGQAIDSTSIPTVDDFKDSIEDLCEKHGIKRICVLFDEAVHIFRPEQQRQFFTLFRDLRSPYISCNAAVYPGVTSYGPVFELAHDATLMRVERELVSHDYIELMRRIALGQADESIGKVIEKNPDTFSALAYAVTGNPRLLLKTLSLCPRLSNRDVNDVIKTFYRSTIWTDHSALSDSFPGHRSLIDWGRDFIERTVLPEMKARNDRRTEEATAYFWIHRDAPERVKQAIRLLAYTGIVQKGEEGIRGTRSELGTRYMVNIGCLLALETTPVVAARQLVGNLSLKRFLEFGSNHPAYGQLQQVGTTPENADTLDDLKHRLVQSVDVLDISDWQRKGLVQADIHTIGDVLKVNEALLIQKLHYVGPVRARRIKNAADYAVLEYLSG